MSSHSPKGGIPCFSPEVYQSKFMLFALNVDDLNHAVDLLVFCQSKKGWPQVCEYMRGQLRMAGLNALYHFLTSQGLLRRLKSATRDGQEDGVSVQAIPHAIDELIYRLAHQGEPSSKPQPPPPPTIAEQCQQARERVNAGLAAAGFKTKEQVRLHLVN